MLEQIITISLIATTVLISLNIWKIDRYYEMWNKPKLFPQSLCYFCLGFWIAVILTTFLIFYEGLSWKILILPFASASLTRLLFKWVVD